MSRGRTPPVKDTYSTHDVAKICCVTPTTVIRWIEDGLIPAFKTVGGHRRVRREDLEKVCRDRSIPFNVPTGTEVGRILVDAGYAEDLVARVGSIVKKQGLGRDEEVQTLEDALCLVFLELQFHELAARLDEEKLLDVTRKTLDGLYFMIGEQEKAFRRNPVGATSEIGRTVFGTLR